MQPPPPAPAAPCDLLDLSGRSAIVTGAARGLGAGIAARLAAAGASVVVNHRSGDAGAVVAAIREAGGRAVAVRADVADADGPRELVRRCLEVFGHVDVLVNNAGVQPVASLPDIPDGQWEAVLAANLSGAGRCVQESARVMGPGASIVNVASIEGLQPQAGHAHYGASKAGLLALTRAAAHELGPRGIRVNAVAPGLVWRQGLDRDWPEGVTRWEAAAPLGRVGHPDDVADAVLFLASAGARWVTGATLVVDGGVAAVPSW